MTMTTVDVRVPASLRRYTADSAVVEVDLGVDTVEGGDGPTVRSVLDRLREVHPDLERRVRDEQGDLRPHVNLFVGVENVKDLAGLATPLADGDELSIIPAVSGGDAG
jgi:molybdopterin converting factor small subunit